MHKGERLHHARQPPAVLAHGGAQGVLRTDLWMALHCWVAPDSIMFVNIFLFLFSPSF